MTRRQPRSDSVPGLTWARAKPPRGARTSLDRDTAVSAAIELLDELGVDGLSMRKLGDRLGTAATTLYWHVANKEELLDIAFDEVMRELPDLSTESTGIWRDDVASALGALRELALRHRWYPTLYSTRPSVGPHALKFWGGILEVLGSTGLAGADLDNAFCMLTDYVVGSTAINLSYDSWLKSDADAIDAIHTYVRGAVASLPTYAEYIDSYIARTDAEVRRDRRYEFALGCMLDALAVRLEAAKT